MGRRSAIESDLAIRTAVDAAIAGGATIDDIVERLRSMGSGVSRSAVGRYAKEYQTIAARQRDIHAAAKAFAGEFGEVGNTQGRFAIQLITGMITRVGLEAASADDGEDAAGYSTKELADLSRALKDVTSAAKIDVERETKIREEASRRAKEEAASAAETALKTAGASPETMRNVRMGILGLRS